MRPKSSTASQARDILPGHRKLHFISAGIRQALAHGRPSKLQRLWSGTAATKNRGRMCPSSFKPPTGAKSPTKQPGWPKGQLPGCDEYPFASTHQGGNLAKGWRTWRPRSENQAQSNLIKSFYYQNRLLDGDWFTVSV
jgi:deoxyribonuclease NucA/NucB